jgi:hypothetical protein
MVEDEKLSWLVGQLVGLIEIQNEAFEPPDDSEARLNDIAAEIARAVLLLSRFSKLKATIPRSRARLFAAPTSAATSLVPADLAKKYKQCCLANRAYSQEPGGCRQRSRNPQPSN